MVQIVFKINYLFLINIIFLSCDTLYHMERAHFVLRLESLRHSNVLLFIWVGYYHFDIDYTHRNVFEIIVRDLHVINIEFMKCKELNTYLGPMMWRVRCWIVNLFNDQIFNTSYNFPFVLLIKYISVCVAFLYLINDTNLFNKWY